jgi:hypothetical protein
MVGGGGLEPNFTISTNHGIFTLKGNPTHVGRVMPMSVQWCFFSLNQIIAISEHQLAKRN